MQENQIFQFRSLVQLRLPVPQLVLAYPLKGLELGAYEVIKDTGGRQVDSYYPAQIIYPLHFKEPERFLQIVHKAAGHACHRHLMHALPLVPTALGWEIMRELENRYLDSCVGMWGSRLSEVVSYCDFLKVYKLDCEYVYEDFMEAIYPIDATSENLKALTTTSLPTDLDDLFDKSEGLFRLPWINQARIYILGSNCD
jgi:hypothetical protein